MSNPPSSSANDSLPSTNPTSTGARSARGPPSVWGSSNSRQGSRRGLTPISTSSAGQPRPPSSSGSPATFSPTSSHFNQSAFSANRQVTSRHSSTSSNNSFISPPTSSHATGQIHGGNRSRAVTSTSSPRLASSIASISSASQQGGIASGGGAGGPRLVRHSPSLSISTAASPVSSTGPHSAGGLGQLTSLVVTQLNILLSTLKENNFEAQAEKIRNLVDDIGMDGYTTYFRRLLQSNASTIFPGSARPPAATEASGQQYKLLAEEMSKISKEAQKAEDIAKSLDTNESELFRDFDLSAFVDHFKLSPIAKVALVLPIRLASKPDLRTKADAILSNSFQSFLQSLSAPQNDPQDDVSATVLAALIERLIHDPPRNGADDPREHLKMATKMRYSNMRARMPSSVDSAIFLLDMMDTPESRLARLVQRAGPRATATLDACKDMLGSVETRDISYSQIANALLFMVCSQSSEPYDPGLFVEGLRQHRAGPKIDWTDVVTGFDKDQLHITKAQFLALYGALLPLAKEYANFDIQSLWSGQWQFAETQLSFVVAFLSTIPQDLDVTQIPNLRQAFSVDDFEDASDSVKAFAAEAVKHPLVSQDATEALFTMIFRSQETYNHAQMLGIPDTLINPNMTIFVCAASAVPKPWAALQDQALKQLFYPFLLKQHDNYDFVMHSLWLHDRHWVATRMVEFYQQDQMLLNRIFEHAQEQGWLELLLTIQSSFAVDLATYAHGKGHCNLQEWAQPHMSIMGPAGFARAIRDFLTTKVEDETQVQQRGVDPTTPPLAVKTVHLLLLLINDSLADEEAGPIFRQCLGAYPRLFNYGESNECDAIIDSNGERTNALPEEVAKKMEDQYKDMYSGKTSPDQMVAELKRLKTSDSSTDQDLFAGMLHGLFDEYNCFGEYPNEALATTAVLFGGLIAFNVLSGVAEQAAIYMIFEAVSEYGPEDPMYKFGLQAMVHLLGRIKEWPHLAERILHIPSLRNTQAVEAAEKALQELQQASTAMNGDTVNGLTNGTADDDFSLDPANQPFSSVSFDPPLRPHLYEDPNEEVSDKVMFVLNNVSKRNLEEKFRDLESALEERHHQWFAHYLVEELAKHQLNFQGLYLQLLDHFDQNILWEEVLRETYVSCAKMLNAEATMQSAMERTNLKNLANWLGSLTLGRNRPILHRNISFSDLLIEGHETQRLIVAIPFTCKALIHAAKSKTFKPPNPWLMELLGLLSELYHCFELKLNLKFEIEVLCKDLDTDIKEIEPLEVIRTRHLMQENNLLQHYVQDGGPDGFGDMALMGLSKRAPNERFSPAEVINALPDLGNMLQIPQAAGNSIPQPQLRNIFINAAQQAISEIIAPVVERSVTIAAISSAELIQKDFATEPDNEKLRSSAHTMVKALSGSLALVTCKEPLRMSIMNNIRTLAGRSLSDQLPEGQIIMFVNDNIDTVCSLVEQAAEEHSVAEIDAQLQDALAARRRHMAENPNEPFNNPPVNRYGLLIPEPFKLDPNGLNRQQLALYEDFGRQARITPAQHATNQSQDSQRQLPDVLSDSYLPNLPTPAADPAMPRQTPGQQLRQVAYGQQTQYPMNGYVDAPSVANKLLEHLQDLQSAAREAPEEHIDQISPGAPIRRIFDQIIMLIESATGPQKDDVAYYAGRKCFYPIFTEPGKRLEIEIFARVVRQICMLSPNAGRQLTIELATIEDESVFRVNTVIALLAEQLFDTQHVDVLCSKWLKARRPIVLDFLKDFLDEALLGEEPLALRSEFGLTYDALGQWLSEDPPPEFGREIITKLQVPPSQQNGMPSPQASEKNDQLAYIFEEWIRLQRRETPERTYLAFIRQMQEQHVISDPKDAVAFFRACLDLSVEDFDRVSNSPWRSDDAPYVSVDALAKLIAYMVMFQATGADGEVIVKHSKSFDAIMRLVIFVINDHQIKQKAQFNGRVYFRLFSAVLCELHSGRQHLGAQSEQEIAQVFAIALQILQPKFFSGFTYHWLALVSHRLFVPSLLGGAGRTNGGWDTFTKLLHILFTTLDDLLDMQDSPVLQEFYRGTTRFLLMLHHDYPEFLIENHTQLNSSIPVRCFQFHNIVNSAVTRAVINDQPDPFTPGLKINRLDQVRQPPAVCINLEKILEEAGVKDALQRCCSGANELTSGELDTILSTLERVQGVATRMLCNAMVLYIGENTTKASSVFSAAAAPARLLAYLLKESSEAVRYHLITAMMNQVRYVNAHTHYFSGAVQHFFGSGTEDLQQNIMRVLAERLGVPRPHPWGVIVMILELLKDPALNIFDLPWMKTAPQVESMLLSLAQSQERMPARSPLGPLAM